MDFSNIFNASLIYATFRSATPIIYAALCAAITQQADILNIGTEGIMLIGAFMAVAVSYLTGSWALGVVVAMISGLIIAMVMAVGNIKFKADICAIGMGINMFALAITKFLLNAWLGQSGTFMSPDIKSIPKVSLPFLEGIPFLNDIFNNWYITEWFVIILIAVLWFVFYKTVWGLRLRAVGRMPMAAQTAGINVEMMKYQAIAISGLVGGLAGAHLAAMYFGGAHPVFTALGCFVFGFSDSIGARLQANGVPSQLVLLMPYVVTIVVLAISMATKMAAEKKRKSSLSSQ